MTDRKRRLRIRIGFCDGANRLKQCLIDLGVKNKAVLKLDGKILDDKALHAALDEISKGPIHRQKLLMDALREICRDIGWSPAELGLYANSFPTEGVGECFIWDELGPKALDERDAEATQPAEKSSRPAPGLSIMPASYELGARPVNARAEEAAD